MASCSAAIQEKPSPSPIPCGIILKTFKVAENVVSWLLNPLLPSAELLTLTTSAMTGVEAAGFVLGVLPLLISAAEHYEDAFRPFERYRKFAPELKLYQQQLGTQKVIFRNECHWLLATLTSGKVARDMLREGRHPSWTDSTLDEKFARQLGDSGAACKTIINLIQTKLKSVEEETQGFGLAIQQSIPLGSVGDKAWRSRVGKKLKFSLSEPRLEKTLEDLRKLNQDFQTLASQTTRLTNAEPPLPSSVFIPPRSDQKVKECRLVQKASAQLYLALQRACQLHEEHSAHFRLETQHVNVEGTGSPLVRFNMAFAHRPGISSAGLEPVWIAVDSTLDEESQESVLEDGKDLPFQSHESLNALSNSLKREVSSESPSPVKRLKKCVRFARTTPSTGISQSTNLVASFLLQSALPDFCVQHDFCKQLHRTGPRTPENKYIGYFEKSGPCKHLVYFAPPITSCSLQQSVTLTSIVSSMSQKSQVDQFLHYERLQLARQLASAVLQFHATPLLRSSWQSDDVVFFRQSGSSLTSPHLNVQVGKSNSAAKLLNSGKEATESQSFIRNPYLFRLSVILIELAYQAPLRSLLEARDLTNGQESKHTDFFIAERLSKSMGTSLGASYAKIVRKCLGCDFGEGTTDLNDPGLQAVFYKDVVCELERLERAFVQLQLGP